jgi:hypothetical protein
VDCLYNHNHTEEAWRKAEKEIFEKVFKIIGELSDIENEYCKWDIWNKSNILFDAKNILLNGFEKEMDEKMLTEKE